MARLCGLSSVQEVADNRWALARERAATWQAVVLLKGPYTVIADPEGDLAVLPIATAALATAGTGDVLAGVITGLLAQGLSPFHAACLGLGSTVGPVNSVNRKSDAQGSSPEIYCPIARGDE